MQRWGDVFATQGTQHKERSKHPAVGLEATSYVVGSATVYRRRLGRRKLRTFWVGLVSAVVLATAIVAVLVATILVRRRRAPYRRDGRARAPSLELPVLANGDAVERENGAVLALSELRGHPVVLNFWAPWSDASAREAPLLEAAWRARRGSGLVVVGVDVRDLDDNALPSLRRRVQTYVGLTAKTDDVYLAYGLEGVPSTYFIDHFGRIRARVVGEVSKARLTEESQRSSGPDERGRCRAPTAVGSSARVPSTSGRGGLRSAAPGSAGGGGCPSRAARTRRVGDPARPAAAWPIRRASRWSPLSPTPVRSAQGHRVVAREGQLRPDSRPRAWGLGVRDVLSHPAPEARSSGERASGGSQL